MSRSVEFFFDFGSPATYLAYTQLPAIAARTGAEITWTPVLLGGVFKATGNRPPASINAKGKWLFADLQRFAKRYSVPLRFNPHFPVNTLALMRGACAIQRDMPARFDAYCETCFEGMWVNPRNLQDQSELRALLQSADFDPYDWATRVEERSVKELLKNNTTRAVDLGVFGAPTFIVNNELHFGQDRLDFVEEALLSNLDA